METHSAAVLKPVTWHAWHTANPIRLKQERDAMAKRFPSFVLTKGHNEKLGWAGALTSNRGKHYKVLVEYSEDFPNSEPAAYILEPRFISQHMWKNKRLCLMYPGDGTWKTNTTCASIVALVAAWIFAYENHATKCQRNSGRPCLDPECPDWPGPKK
jgi:ubiquitin-protein ligase